MAFAWIMILLGVILAFVGMLHCTAAHSLGLEKRNEMIESLVKAFGVKKRSAFVRVFSFVQVILIIAAISYVRWVFTAVAYAFTVLALQIAKISVRDAAEKYERSLSQQKGGDELDPINLECKR